MSEIRIMPKGSEWIVELARQHNIPPEVLDKVLQELGDKIKEILAEYRTDHFGTVLAAVKEEELGSAREVAERLLRKLGLIEDA